MRRRSIVTVLAGLAAAGLAGGRAAHAASGDVNVAIAKSLFERGLYLMKRGDCADAVELYAEAEWRAPGSAYADLSKEMSAHCAVREGTPAPAPLAGAPPAATPESMPAVPPPPRPPQAPHARVAATGHPARTAVAADTMQPIDPYASEPAPPRRSAHPPAHAQAKTPLEPYAERVADDHSAAPAPDPYGDRVDEHSPAGAPPAPVDPYGGQDARVDDARPAPSARPARSPPPAPPPRAPSAPPAAPPAAPMNPYGD